jgi:ankyrin repeat protein
MRITAFVLLFWLGLASAALAASQTPRDQSEELRAAVRDGKIDAVERLLREGVDVNSHVENHFTPIFFAGDPKMIDLLLRYKPNLSIRDDARGQTPIERAAEQVCLDEKRADVWRTIVEKLRGAGAEYTNDTAIYMNDVEYLRKELEKGDSWVNPRYGSLCSPLRRAARVGRLEICKLLLKHKADPDGFEEGMGYPILVEAIGHPAVVKLLIDSGANLRRRITWLGGSSGIKLIGDEATLLHFAAEAGELETAKILARGGLDVNAADMDGQTPLHVAIQAERFFAAYEFVEPGQPGKNTKCYLDTIRFLLDHDASLRFEDKSGKTVLDVAKEIDSPKGIKDLLQKYKDDLDERYSRRWSQEEPQPPSNTSGARHTEKEK